MSLTPDSQIADLLDTARAAGRDIMKIYETDFEVRAKEDESPVTQADEIAEAIILKTLARLTPSVPVIAEEAYTAGHRPDVSAGTFWLVDALDGTKEFVKRTGEFTVNIALIHDFEPVFGIVHAPAIDQTYWGGAGKAFHKDKNDEATPIHARSPNPAGLVVMTSRSHRSTEEDFLKDINVAEERNAGSSIKFCLIAAGEADLYPRLGPTHEWDTGAGHAVLAAAGGSVTTLDGAPLEYGKENFKNPFFVARGLPNGTAA